MDEVREIIELTGFDPDGEPEIRIMADGSLYVVFNFMPPSYANDEGDFSDFDKQFEQAAGVPVLWDDREVFVIFQPQKDTISRIRTFIEGYRRKNRNKNVRGRWTTSEVRRQIVDALNPVLNPAGFRFKKKSEAFVRKLEGDERGRQEFGIPLFEYHPLYKFSFVLCIRLDAVQEIVNRFAGVLAEDYGDTMTSCTQLEYFDLPEHEYQVHSEAELAAVMPGICAMVREKVIPFFDQYRGVTSLNGAMNPEGAERGNPPLWSRAFFGTIDLPYNSMVALTVAYLAKDSRLKDLIAAYQIPGNPKVVQLVDFLLAT